MEFNPGVLDIWVFRRTEAGVRYLLLHASQRKADRHFNGGRFWQVPSGAFAPGETAVAGVDRILAGFGLSATAVWAAEHAYTIYNRRFEEIQLVAVFAAEVDGTEVRLDPEEHAEVRWCTLGEGLELVHYRGLKDGLRSTAEYVTGA